MRNLWIVVIVALIAFGQQTPPPVAAQPAGKAAKFTSNSNVVIVDVTVKDKSGNAIDSLTQDDFSVLEDGHPQTVNIFEHQKLTMEPEPPEPPPSLEDKNELPPPPKTVITSEGATKVQYHDKRLMAMFFDFSNMQIPDQLRAQDAALKFLEEKMTKSDLVAILLYTTNVQVLTDFTADRMILTDSIKNLPIGDAADLAGLADDGSADNQDTGAAFVADETEFNIFNTDAKLAAVEETVKRLSQLPEKKALVYITDGISKSGIDNQAQLEATINAATKANVAIYPLDARGLMAAPPGGAASSASSRGSGLFTGSTINSQRATVNDSQETLSTLAADTGGKVFLDSNDLALGITQVQEQFRSYYILGYNTTNSALDGKYRKITVKLKNPALAGAKLEFRDGYYGDKVWGKQNSDDKEKQLKDAMTAVDPPIDIPILVEVDWFRISPSAYAVPISVKIPGSVIALAQKKSGGETEFDFIGNVMDERKQVVSQLRDYIHIKLPTTEAEKLAQRNFNYDALITVSPGRYHMRFLVREGQTGKLGTYDMKFTVPDLAADSMTLKTSSIVWSSQREMLKAAVGSAEQVTKKVANANPLITGEQKVVPNIGKVFRRGQNVYVDFDVYDAAPDPKNANARDVAVKMSLFNLKGEKQFEVGPVKATQLVGTRPEAVPVQIQFPLKGLAPGHYVCQLNVIDEVGRKFAFPRTNVIIQ
jgi:VWFA-related protein